MSEVHVIAVITCKPGKRAEVLEVFQANVPAVHAETGCLAYEATVDAEGLGPVQVPFGEDSFVVVERWASLEDLKAHAVAPHMKDYGAKVKDLLAERKIHVLRAV